VFLIYLHHGVNLFVDPAQYDDNWSNRSAPSKTLNYRSKKLILNKEDLVCGVDTKKEVFARQPTFHVKPVGNQEDPDEYVPVEDTENINYNTFTDQEVEGTNVEILEENKSSQ
jgi:hypothetical protein